MKDEKGRKMGKTLLSSRLKIEDPGIMPWAVTKPADLKDMDGWPLRVGAKVVRKVGKRVSGIVVETVMDWKGRPLVRISVNGALHSVRPHEVRVMRRSGTPAKPLVWLTRKERKS